MIGQEVSKGVLERGNYLYVYDTRKGGGKN